MLVCGVGDGDERGSIIIIFYYIHICNVRFWVRCGDHYYDKKRKKMKVKENLQIDSPMDVLVLLLYTQGRSGKINEPIPTITRLQKLMFLLQQREGTKNLSKTIKEYQFKPHLMGPFSSELYDDINELISAGIVHEEVSTFFVTDDEDGGHEQVLEDEFEMTARIYSYDRAKARIYSLTELGGKIGKDLSDNLGKKDKRKLVDLKEFFNFIPLRQLLIFVYESYPEFISKNPS